MLNYHLREIESCQKLFLDRIFIFIFVYFWVNFTNSINKMQRFIVIFENNLKLMLIKNSFELIIAEDLTSDPPYILYWWKRNGDQRFWKSWSRVIVISVVSKSFLRHLEPSTNVVLRETWLEFHDFSFNDYWIIRIDKSLIYW